MLFALVCLPAFALAQGKKPPGVSVTYSAGGKSDTVSARLVALHVPKSAPATPFLPTGPFKAVFTGDIDSPLRSEYTFAVEVRGHVKISINGKELLDAAGAAAAQYQDKAVQLNKGANAVVVEFETDAEEDAELRFDWWNKEFPREPVPPTAWAHTPAGDGAKLREGRMLFATRHCAACHDAGAAVPKDGSGMMELLMTAPDLAEAGARLRPEWLAAWIENPRAHRADATMPNLGLTKEQAADVAAYLASLGKPVETKIDAEKAAAGGGHFGKLGCVACHTTPDFAGKDEHTRLPLAPAKAKFQPAALIEFLKMPAMHSGWTRMPNFRLTDPEAQELAAYLLTTAKAEFPAVKGDAAKGKASFATLGCANCHAGAEASQAKAPALAAALKTGGGCLAEAPGKAPNFGFTPAQREALTAFLKTDLSSLKQDTFSDFATRQIGRMNCTACHPMDGRQSTWQSLEEETSALIAAAPQPEQAPEGPPIPPTAVPHLTWFGEKLQTGWMGAFIAGAAPYKPRPWLASRMPGFGAPAMGIANGLSQQHGLPLIDPPQPAPDKERAAIGAKLMTADEGFNCVQCHGVKDQAATAVFEAPGINLEYARDRLRKGYYQRWMLAPTRVDPETKMPKFSEDGVTTQRAEVLGGKAADQFDAVWQYLQSLK
jgi:mono/diheme cytochrome c family protein